MVVREGAILLYRIVYNIHIKDIYLQQQLLTNHNKACHYNVPLGENKEHRLRFDLFRNSRF